MSRAFFQNWFFKFVPSPPPKVELLSEDVDMFPSRPAEHLFPVRVFCDMNLSSVDQLPVGKTDLSPTKVFVLSDGEKIAEVGKGEAPGGIKGVVPNQSRRPVFLRKRRNFGLHVVYAAPRMHGTVVLTEKEHETWAEPSFKQVLPLFFRKDRRNSLPRTKLYVHHINSLFSPSQANIFFDFNCADLQTWLTGKSLVQ